MGHLAEPRFGISVENAFFLAPFPVGTEVHPHSSAGACAETVGSWWESCLRHFLQPESVHGGCLPEPGEGTRKVRSQTARGEDIQANSQLLVDGDLGTQPDKCQRSFPGPSSASRTSVGAGGRSPECLVTAGAGTASSTGRAGERETPRQAICSSRTCPVPAQPRLLPVSVQRDLGCTYLCSCTPG